MNHTISVNPSQYGGEHNDSQLVETRKQEENDSTRKGYAPWVLDMI